MGRRIISFVLVFAIVLSLIVIPSYAFTPGNLSFGYVPFLTSTSNNDLVSSGFQVYNDPSGRSYYVGSTLDVVVKVGLFSSGSDTYVAYFAKGDLRSTSAFLPYLIPLTVGGSIPLNYYLSDYDISYYTGAIRPYSNNAVSILSIHADFDSLVADVAEGGWSGPEPDYVYVSACYNDLPLSLSNQGLWLNSGSVAFDGSYDLYDGAYTPLWDDSVPSNIIAPDVRVSFGPSVSSAQYIVYKGHPFSSADYSSLSVTGTYSFWAEMAVDYEDLLRPSETFRLYPSFVCLAVNGDPYGGYVSGSNGVFSFNSVVDLSKIGDVYSIGVWAYFSDVVSASWTRNCSAGFFASDDLEIVGSSVSVVYPEPTPRPSEPSEIVYYQPITPEDTTTDLLPNIPDDVMDVDGSKNRSVWDLIRALVKASWSLTTGIVGNAFNGVSGIVAGVSSIGNFFDYMAPDSSDGAFGIVNYEGDDLWD